ncbi:MAG: 50S ribosomal protein L3 [Myxococcota bacterium]|nr:50S ribosomal protein L3 [Myxococcota bacterium]
MAHGLIGRKVGMTQIFDEEGRQVPVSVIELGPNRIIQVKTAEGKDGYNAIKLGFEDIDVNRLNRPDAGVYHHAGIEPSRHVREFRVAPELIEDATPGDVLTVTMFEPGQRVDVTGTSKGKGYAGVVKRHGFKGAKEMTHGTHEYKRHAGSIGCSAWPARVIKGKKMPGQMGDKTVTVRSLTVVATYPEENLLLVKGAIPGSRNGIVYTELSAKQQKQVQRQESKRKLNPLKASKRAGR